MVRFFAFLKVLVLFSRVMPAPHSAALWGDSFVGCLRNPQHMRNTYQDLGCKGAPGPRVSINQGLIMENKMETPIVYWVIYWDDGVILWGSLKDYGDWH